MCDFTKKRKKNYDYIKFNESINEKLQIIKMMNNFNSISTILLQIECIKCKIKCTINVFKL